MKDQYVLLTGGMGGLGLGVTPTVLARGGVIKSESSCQKMDRSYDV
jgi:hypothetical protein